MSGNLYVRQPKELPQIIWNSSSDCRQIPSVSMHRSCPKHAWLFDAACAMSGCKKIVIFKKITSAAFKSMSKFVEIQSRLTFSCKSWKNVSQIIDFADIFPGFLYFLHFWGIIHPSKFHFMEIRWQNFKNKQILSAPEHLLLFKTKFPFKSRKAPYIRRLFYS